MIPPAGGRAAMIVTYGTQRGTGRPEAWQFEQMITEIRAFCDDLESGVLNHETSRRGPVSVYDLRDLAVRRPKDGRPAGSPGMGAGAPSSVLDDLGVPMPPLSDPVGEAAVINLDGNPLYPLLRRVHRELGGALEQMRRAVGVLVKAEPPPPAHGEPGCRSCARLGLWEPVYRDERCRWCYDYALAEQEDPLIPVLEHRIAGRRVTQNMINQAKRERDAEVADERRKERRGRRRKAKR